MWKKFSVLLLLASGLMSQSVKDEIRRDTEFSLEFYKNVFNSLQGNENTIVSPLSIRAGMLMFYKSATSSFGDQIRSILKFPDNVEKAVEDQNTLIESLRNNSAVKIGAKALVTKNKIIQKDFLNYLTKNYPRVLEVVDFSKKSQLVYNINSWVSQKTDKLIKNFITEAKISDDAELMLLNVISMDATWKTIFDPALTAIAPFTTNNKVYEVDMMYLEEVDCRYSYHKEMQVEVVELPYSDECDLSMMLILPHRDVPIEDVVRKLNIGTLNDIEKGFEDAQVCLKMPKMTIEKETNVKEVLGKMGMTNFEMNVFEGSSSVIGNILQKAYIKVNEKGTTAAAATATEIIFLSGKTEFIVDRPFIFIIRSKSSKATLFIGHYSNPGIVANE